MTDDNDIHQTAGAQLTDTLDDHEERLDDQAAAIDGLDADLEEHAKTLADHDRRLELVEELDPVEGVGDVDTERIRAIVREEFAEEIEAAAARIMLPSRKVGPSPAGRYHTVDRWGIDFSVGREAHIGECVVDADESGTFEAALYRFDGEDIVEVVDARELRVEAGVSEIALDMAIPDAGRYLLTRVGDFPLRRREWGGWDSQSREGITLHGGNKPDSVDTGFAPYEANEFWYYFFDLEIAADADAH